MDAVAELRGRIESVALDHTLDPADRLAKLDALHDELMPILGELTRRRSDVQKVREAAASEAVREVLWARENADLRVELLEIGEFDAETLDEMGMLSHAELDRLEEEGLLVEAVMGIARKWEEALHPRVKSRKGGGEFAKKLGGGMPSAPSVKQMEPQKETTPVHRLVPGDRFEAPHRTPGPLTAHKGSDGKLVGRDERGRSFEFDHGDTVSRHVDPTADRHAEHDERAMRALADYHAVRAEAAEAEITPALQEAVKGEGGELHGLEHRLKSRASIVSKIRRKRETMPLATDEERAASIADLVRYTTTFDTDSYNRGVEKTMGALADKGFKTVEIKNFWGGNDDYDGLHAIMESPAGVQVELQFHTPESLDVKEGQLHPLFEKFRESKDAHERWDLWHQMVDATNSVPKPKGVEEIAPSEPTKSAKQRELRGEHVPPPGKLPENHSDYFTGLDHPDTQTIPLDQLVPTKPPEGQPKSVEKAQTLMADAAAGKTEKRAPITVRQRPDGKWDVVDGNATYGAAVAQGWKSLPTRQDGGYKPPSHEEWIAAQEKLDPKELVLDLPTDSFIPRSEHIAQQKKRWASSKPKPS